ncbi:MAG: ABC transporter substrate-binding protein [Actinobacteria bacterium]|nr:ABC transporter substrate-binding protein [Actinomycetota bacterium]
MLIAACGGDDEKSDTTSAAETTAGEATETTAAAVETTAAAVETTAAAGGDAWAVSTDDCIDPDAANAPIEGTIKIGSAMPLTGGVAAAAFAPVKGGFEAYINYANEKGLLGDMTVEATIEDDQYNKDLTPGAVSKQIDAGVHIFSGIIGSPNNAAVRDTLNEECIPQLNALTGSPAWGEVADYPWTTGILVPYTVESKVYAAQIAEQYPEGAKVAMFYVNNEFGQVYANAFKELAPEFNLEIVDEQTIEATDSAPPTSQITSIAAKAPDVIMAVPLGAGCIGFLTELANAKAQNAGWAPATYVTNTCASNLILGAAGAAADGLYTSGNLKDVTAPSNAEDPAVKEYLDYMNAQGLSDIAATAAAGWTTAEVTIAIIKQAMESEEGLTRASIINAARNFEFVPMLAREGVNDKSMGEEDPFLAESLQVLQYDADTATFTDIGTLITDFES